MKRKRNQCNDGTNNNCNEKKLRIEEAAAGEYENDEDITEFDTSISKKEEFVLTREIAHNAILCDISGKQWRIGAPIGKGSFGEIYLASDNVAKPVEISNAPYVTKIEPHSNGPLFVEIHCLLNVNKQQQQELEESGENESAKIDSLGIPKYIASGSHYFNESRYRFLIMPRYKADLHSIIKIGRLSRKHFLIVAHQIIDVLTHLHEKHYVHSDIKSENIMMGLHDHVNSCFTHHTPIPLTNGYKKTLKLNTSVQFSGANPLRSCRMKDGVPDKSHHSVYNDMVQSHYLRPGRAVVNYALDENSRNSHTHESDDESNNDDSDDDFRVSPRATKRKRRSYGKAKPRKASKSPTKASNNVEQNDFHLTNEYDENDHVYLIDYGLATKFVDTNGEHRPFCMDQRRAHDGTLEFTSRDAHFGTHSRRSDLECLGYNLIYWSEGYLPWKDEKLKEQPELVHRLKEVFMTDVKEMLKLLYGKEVPKFLGDYMEYVGHLEFDQEPDYIFLKGLFEKEFIKLGKFFYF
jgi:serine/threonine protein kinase